MQAPESRKRILDPRWMGIVLGLLVGGAVLLAAYATNIPARLELAINDFYFQFRARGAVEEVEEGITLAERNPFVSEDILIVGIDFNALNRLGRWPFPRSRHADLVNSFSRISDQTQRESLILLDLFFVEPSETAHNDALLVDAIRENERVMVETVLEGTPPSSQSYDELFSRHDTLFETHGRIGSIDGDWQELPAWEGLQPLLKPYGRAAAGFGHANMTADIDGVFRQHALVIKSSRALEEITLSELQSDVDFADEDSFQRLAWRDRDGNQRTVSTPLSAEELDRLERTMQAEAVYRSVETGDGQQYREYPLRLYQDEFVPAVSLSMAARHVNVSVGDIEVVLGEHIRLPDPQQRNTETGEWEPLMVEDRQGDLREREEIVIPINERGEMRVNFRGPRSSPSRDGHQTFPVRSYAGYVQNPPGPDTDTWPRTRAVQNQILMVGAFAPGMAADELTTPYGLMYGIEILANSLNTILTDQFIVSAPEWITMLLVLAAAVSFGWFSSRMKVTWSGPLAAVIILGYFIATMLLFDQTGYLVNFVQPSSTMALTFILVTAYRVLTEERDKRRIQSMFGRYVSPDVVSEILENPPELGGVDKELTVMFSDIRGFTALSERLSPQELVNHLNVYLSAMTDVILDHRGTLDKYVGDEIMSFWGAPIPQEQHALLACKTAVRQLEVLEELNSQWPPELRIEIGIGINSGIMTVGNMGSSGRMNYTLMGDNVNLGARLEGTNKVYGTNCIISEYTYELVRDEVYARELDTIRVKGKNRPVIIYELLDVDVNEDHSDSSTTAVDRASRTAHSS